MEQSLPDEIGLRFQKPGIDVQIEVRRELPYGGTLADGFGREQANPVDRTFLHARSDQEHQLTGALKTCMSSRYAKRSMDILFIATT